MKRAAFYSLGCKVNQYESEALAELFRNSGYEIVDFDSQADCYIINTCSVTSMSDRKSRQIIRRAKKNNPDAVVIVTGCYAQTAPDEVKKIDGVNLVVGTDNKTSIVSLAESVTPSSCRVMVNDISHGCDFEEMNVSDYTGRTRAFIKIQDGCNQFCSYCIIPYARGRIRSRSRDAALNEARILAANGYKEIILTGIHIASYGAENDDGYDLAAIINEINEIEGIKRIRLSSIEPMTLNRRFIQRISTADKLCPHFHLSLQSGCDETLKRMNRKYTTGEYSEIVSAIREHFPDAAITTDIMTGFPGETEEEFARTVEFVEKIGFAEAHVFEYSQRPGTPAAAMSGQIAPEVKKERSRVIIALTDKSRESFRQSQLGKTAEVLFERELPGEDGIYEGKTPNYIPVYTRSENDLSGEIVKVSLTEPYRDGIFAELIK